MNRRTIGGPITDEQRAEPLGCYSGTWAQAPHPDKLASSQTENPLELLQEKL